MTLGVRTGVTCERLDGTQFMFFRPQDALELPIFEFPLFLLNLYLKTALY